MELEKNNFGCQLCENNACLDSRALEDLKMKTQQYSGCGGKKGTGSPASLFAFPNSQHSPPACTCHTFQLFAPSPEYFYRASISEERKGAELSIDWHFCWRAEISIITIGENLGRQVDFFIFFYFFCKLGCRTFKNKTFYLNISTLVHNCSAGKRSTSVVGETLNLQGSNWSVCTEGGKWR